MYYVRMCECTIHVCMQLCIYAYIVCTSCMYVVCVFMLYVCTVCMYVLHTYGVRMIVCMHACVCTVCTYALFDVHECTPEFMCCIYAYKEAHYSHMYIRIYTYLYV